MIFNNKSRVMKENKNSHVLVIDSKNREIKPETIIKSIIIKDLKFPINKTTRSHGHSRVIGIPRYLIKNNLVRDKDRIDKIEI